MTRNGQFNIKKPTYTPLRDMCAPHRIYGILCAWLVCGLLFFAAAAAVVAFLHLLLNRNILRMLLLLLLLMKVRQTDVMEKKPERKSDGEKVRKQQWMNTKEWAWNRTRERARWRNEQKRFILSHRYENHTHLNACICLYNSKTTADRTCVYFAWWCSRVLQYSRRAYVCERAHSIDAIR